MDESEQLHADNELPPELSELSKQAATITRDTLPDFVFRVVAFFWSENEPRGDNIIHNSLALLKGSREPFHEGNIKWALDQLCKTKRVKCLKVPQKLVFGGPPMRVSMGRPETSWYDLDFVPNLPNKCEAANADAVLLTDDEKTHGDDSHDGYSVPMNMKEIAQLFKKSESTMRRWLTDNQIKSKRVGLNWRIAVAEMPPPDVNNEESNSGSPSRNVQIRSKSIKHGQH